MQKKLSITFRKIVWLFLLGFGLVFSSYAQEGMSTFFVFLNTNTDREKLETHETEALQAAHLANIDSLYQTGDLVAAGPFNDGGGIFILKAENEDTAWAKVNSDPAIKAGRFIIELFEFKMSKGSFCQFKEPVEMLKYKYLRFKPNKQTGEHEKQSLSYAVRSYVNKPNVRPYILFSGDFEDNGGLLVLQNDFDGNLIEFIEQHPYISVGEHRCFQRELWLAKGTFCD